MERGCDPVQLDSGVGEAELPPEREPESAVCDARVTIPALLFDTAGASEQSIAITTAPDCGLERIEIQLSADETAGEIALCTGDERVIIAQAQGRELSVGVPLAPGLNSFYARVTAHNGQVSSERAVHIIKI